MRPRKSVRLAIGIGLLVALGLGSGAMWIFDALVRPNAAMDGTVAEVLIEPGLDAGSVVRRLADAGVIQRPRTVRWWLTVTGAGERLRAGEYRFDRALSAIEVLRRLEAGKVVLRPVVVPEGLDRAEIARRLAAAGVGDEQEFLAAFDDPAIVLEFDPKASDLEGYLFPDTYHFPKGEAPQEVAEAMVRTFRAAIGSGYAAAAKRMGLEVREAVILASMIERETGVAGERARVSRVFHNRLQRGMRLECDPTVQYALDRAGRSTKRLTRDLLRFDSPWNTYVVLGLPRGPISNPGLASLLAAVEPLPGREIYFVAAPDGGHRFSENLAGHLQAVAEWRAYVRSSR